MLKNRVQVSEIKLNLGAHYSHPHNGGPPPGPPPGGASLHQPIPEFHRQRNKETSRENERFYCAHPNLILRSASDKFFCVADDSMSLLCHRIHFWLQRQSERSKSSRGRTIIKVMERFLFWIYWYIFKIKVTSEIWTLEIIIFPTGAFEKLMSGERLLELSSARKWPRGSTVNMMS